MEKQANFMLIFRMTPMQEKPTPEQVAQMHEAWGAYFKELTMQQQMVSTTRLGFDGRIISLNKPTQSGMVMSDDLTVSGTLLIAVDSMEVAEEIAARSPILVMGGTVEIRSILPM